MLDIRHLRQDPEGITQKLRSKDPSIDLSELLELDAHLRQLKGELEQQLHRRHQLSKEIGEAKRQKREVPELMADVERLKAAIESNEQQINTLHPRWHALLSQLPNLPYDDVPVALDPKENVCIKSVGDQPPISKTPKNHVELNERLQLFDFKRGAKISGSGWPVYRGWGARLEWALLQLMVETHLKNGFEQWIPPLLVRQEMMYGVGQLPKFESQLFKLNDPDYPLYLIPTAEAALNALHYDEICDLESLPRKYIAYTPCFRREAGAAGSQERGLIRVHQFNKVEMFAFCLPEKSGELFEELLASAEEVLQQLELHYRNMLLVTGDCSYASAKTVDIEVWLPGQNRYYEVSSVSNCTDFQARRSQIRFKREPQGPTEFVHTLNGSGLATSRLMVALLENNQQEDGSVLIPKVLRKYLDGLERLTPVEDL